MVSNEESDSDYQHQQHFPSDSLTFSPASPFSKTTKELRKHSGSITSKKYTSRRDRKLSSNSLSPRKIINNHNVNNYSYNNNNNSNSKKTPLSPTKNQFIHQIPMSSDIASKPSDISLSNSGNNNNNNTNNATSSFNHKACHGDFIELDDGRKGLIKYIGTPTDKQRDIWYGVSLTEAKGKHDGLQTKLRYWKDKPKHGLFIQPKQVKKIIKRLAKILYSW